MLAVKIGATIAALAATGFVGAWVAEDIVPEARGTAIVGVGSLAMFVVGSLTMMIGAIWV